MVPKTPDHPKVLAPPPLLYFTGLVVGYAFHWIWPWKPFIHLWPMGLLLIGCGVAWALWAVMTMHQVHTPVNPAKTPTALLRHGPFRWTRNPIYLAMTIASVGLAMVLDAPWILLWLIPILLIVHYGVVLREEQFLQEKFGASYEEYRRRVRRWL